MNKKRNITLMKMSAFFSGMGFFRAVLSIYFVTRGVGLEHILYSQTLYSIINLVSEVPTGLIGDKFGHKISILFGRCLAIIPYVIYILFPNMYGLYLSFIVFAIGDAMISGSDEAFTHASSKTGEYKKNIAGIISSEIFGGVVGTATSGILYWLFGDRGIAVLLVLNVLSRALSAMFFIKTKSVKLVGAGEHSTNTRELFKTALGQVWANITLRSLTIVKMLTLGAQYVLYSIYAPYFTDNNVQPVFIGLVLTFGLLSNGIIVKNIHKIERYISIEKTVLILPIVMAITYILFSAIHNPWLLIVVFVLLQAQFNLLDPILSDYIHHEANPSARSTIISTISMISTLANAVSKFLLGLVVATGGVLMMFRAQAIYLFVGGVLSWWILKRCGCVYVLPKTESVIQ